VAEEQSHLTVGPAVSLPLSGRADQVTENIRVVTVEHQSGLERLDCAIRRVLVPVPSINESLGCLFAIECPEVAHLSCLTDTGVQTSGERLTR
jgi:hypothetical protein